MISAFCYIAAMFLTAVVSSTFTRTPVWRHYQIPQSRVEKLSALYQQFNGSDDIIRQLMREADHSKYMIDEYIALAEYMNNYAMMYNMSAVIFAGNLRHFILKDRDKFSDLHYAYEMFPRIIKNFPIGIDQFIINFKSGKYLIKSPNIVQLITNSSDFINLNRGAMTMWRFIFNRTGYSYTIVKDGEKWYVDDEGMIRLIEEEKLSDGKDQWQFIPEPLLDIENDMEYPLKYRIENESENKCVCEAYDTIEDGNLIRLQQFCDFDNCIWEIVGPRYYLWELFDRQRVLISHN